MCWDNEDRHSRLKLGQGLELEPVLASCQAGEARLLHDMCCASAALETGSALPGSSSTDHARSFAEGMLCATLTAHPPLSMGQPMGLKRAAFVISRSALFPFSRPQLLWLQWQAGQHTHRLSRNTGWGT